MTHSEQISDGGATRARLSRRTLIKRLGALGLSLSGFTAQRQHALAAPAVSVAAPAFVQDEACLVTVSVRVSIANAASDVRYEAYGDILEYDEPNGDPDFCCTLRPQRTSSGTEDTQDLLLTRQTMAADIGLVKGIGPAGDEMFSPDLVELFARIWLRDLQSGAEYGPWDSPQRIAVASGGRAWTHAGLLPGGELLVPRGGGPHSTQSGIGQSLPPQACVS